MRCRREKDGPQRRSLFHKVFAYCNLKDQVLCLFYKATYVIMEGDVSKEKILQKVVLLYFKIRAHHKC